MIKINVSIKTTRLFSRIVLLAAVISVAACSPDGNGETQPGSKSTASTLSSTEDGNRLTVPFITLRNKTGNDKASKFFGDERSTAHTGYCGVSRTSIEPLKSIADKAPFYIPEDIVKLDAIKEISVEELWQGMQSISNGRHPILYLHGFYINFNKACKRASLFQDSLGLAGRLLLFSWPSDGALLNYTQDEADLYWSVAPLEKTLNDMISRFGAGNIDIAAHSLGTRGVFLALVSMAHAKHANTPLINQVVLIAPDIDVGIFKQYLPQIQSLARNITIYVSGNDRPLALSRQVHGYPRLGESGTHLQGLKGIEIIDLSDIPVRYPSGHVYHLYHDIVINDLNQLLNEGKPASLRSNLKQTGEYYWRLQLPANDK